MNSGPRPGAGRMAGVGSLMLLDSASLYFRAFYGVPADSMTAPDGTPVNAVRGLLDMIARLIRARRPGRLSPAWTRTGGPPFRVAAIPSYKAHRANPDGTEQVPEALTAQIPVIVDVLAAAGVAMAGAPGTRPTTSSAHSRRRAAARSRWSPETGTCSSSSTTPGRSG